MKIWIFVALFVAILAVLSWLNYKLNNQFKIETSWLALGLAPVVIWLISTQQLSEFSGFGLAFKLKEATAKPVSMEFDGNFINPEHISQDSKGGLDKIDDFKRNKTAAITLVVGKQHYYANSAIGEYLYRLTPYSYFKYVIFVDASGKFVAKIEANKLFEEMQSNDLDLVERIESGNITNIPGVVQTYIESDASKQESLSIMDKHGLSELAVVDSNNVFIGVVERDKITSSIVAKLVSISSN